MDPDLKPAEVIELIRAGCEKKHYGDHDYLLLNPKRSGELLSKRLAK
jgi:hypothetical protein